MSEAAAVAKEAMARGDLIAAYDATSAAIAEGDESGAVRHQQLLALARMGDTERAMELFETYGLAESNDVHERAVGARLLKDRALVALPHERQRALDSAFDAYHAIYRDSGDSFPGINAATLALLAGDTPRAKEIATAVLGDPAVAAAGDYYMAVTKAEALLVLGRAGEVTGALSVESVLASRDFGARSSASRQLAMVARHLGLDSATQSTLLAPLAPPRVMHFCGHMFAADPEAEARLKAEAGAIIAEEEVGFAFGAIACGSDLILAEAALERGIQLHIILPFSEEDFLAQSVRPGGDGWEARFRAVRDAAARTTFASEIEFFGDPVQYGYASRMAMGMARLRAEHLVGEAIQLAIWDGRPSNGPAGTGEDVRVWAKHGGRARLIDPAGVDRDLTRPPPRVKSAYERDLAAILFTDFQGFSTLSESALPIFWDGVMRIVAEILDGHAGEVECRNSWGDALYAVTSSAPAAAEIALKLQDRLVHYDYATLGLDGSGGMRIGAHYGPAYRTVDHITGRVTYYGTEVSKAARIEPVTPPGAVFVTEPLAAILTLEARGSYTCRYVGRIALAKKYGHYPMYRLTRAG